MIDILLATYNGSRYIEEQIDSILRQSFSDWRLIVHDDGSTDNTVDIIKRYVSNHPEKIFLIEDGVKTGGAKNNFFHLMKFATSDYVMFCDQDDVWIEEKIFVTLNEMKRHETKFFGEAILVHSDLIITDDFLNVINTSFFNYQKISKFLEFDDYLYCNNVTGCTVMINSVARDLVHDTSSAVMHDWYVALQVLKSGGEICLIDKPLIYYRQHASNAVGAKERNFFYYVKRLFRIKSFFYDLNLAYRQSLQFKSQGFYFYIFRKFLRVLQ